MFSIIIPCQTKQDLCPELLPALKSQTLKPQEILIVTNKICPGDPATKRNWAAKKAKGKLLAFIDSDAYPDKNWLKNAQQHLKPKNICAVGGPNLTPPNNNVFQQISGFIWSTFIGAGGAGVYRNKISKSRLVTDYPSSNLIVKKNHFNKVKGFNTSFWPGEDTKLCHDLVFKLKKQILYHPSVQVFHHRRPIFVSHLQQISRFGYHRGLFAKILPKTSRLPGYFGPSLFITWLILTNIFFTPIFYLTLNIYFSIIAITAMSLTFKTKNTLISVLFFITVPLTHLTYGLYFLKGFFSPTPQLPSKPSLIAIN
jgi:glycosyltransferase involved in cell wall biosynthesis